MKQDGFTLIEIIIAMAAISIIVAVLSVVIVVAQRSAAVDKTRADLAAANRILVDEVARNVKLAATVVSTATVSGQNYTSGSATLILDLPAIDASQNQLAGLFDRLVYHLDGNVLNFIQDADPSSIRPDRTETLSGQVSALTFSYYDNNANELMASYQDAVGVKIDATLEQVIRGLTISNRLADTATLRNK